MNTSTQGGQQGAAGSNSPKRADRNPYEQFSNDRLIMRDHLAIDRTVLANERTLLAYGRTSLALILTGAAYMKFFMGRTSTTVGIALILLGLAAAVIGGWRSAVMARRIRTAGAAAGAPKDNNADGVAEQNPASKKTEQ